MCVWVHSNDERVVVVCVCLQTRPVQLQRPVHTVARALSKRLQPFPAVLLPPLLQRPVLQVHLLGQQLQVRVSLGPVVLFRFRASSWTTSAVSRQLSPTSATVLPLRGGRGGGDSNKTEEKKENYGVSVFGFFYYYFLSQRGARFLFQLFLCCAVFSRQNNNINNNNKGKAGEV